MKKLFAAVFFLVYSTFGFSQSLLVATGGSGNTYSTMFKELSSECVNSIQMNEKNTSGSNENVDLLVANKVNAAIVQTDVMFYRSRTEDLGNVKTLVALHPEEVHFVVLSKGHEVGGVMGFGGKNVSYSQVTELAGKKVAAAGGSVVTAQLIRLQGEIPYTVTEYPNNKAALASLVSGDSDAVVMVGGQPLGDVDALGPDYKLLSFNDALIGKLKNIYVKATLSYRKMNSVGIPTVATTALFVTRDYKSAKYVADLKALRSCFNTNLTDLQEHLGNHPAWQQVKVGDQGKWSYLDLK